MVIAKNYGRMGNYLFQVATSIGYALRHGLEFTVPTTTNNSQHNPIYLQHLTNPKYDPGLPSVAILENGHAFQQLPFKEEWRSKNIILDGYWQSEKYFLQYRDQILKAFNYPWQSRLGFVSVHVRRGDYLRLAFKHPPVPKQWYEQCMKQFPGKLFVFFSDDIDWCIREFSNRDDCLFSKNKSEEEDLVDISCCEHHISSASTFSWWGAWLNRNSNKRILIPKLWFTPREMAKLDTKDIVPESWERV